MAANKVVSDLYLIYFWLRVTYFHIKTASGVYVWFQNIDSQIMGMFKKKERKKKKESTVLISVCICDMQMLN